jgi:hypothetical protein
VGIEENIKHKEGEEVEMLKTRTMEDSQQDSEEENVTQEIEQLLDY